MVSLWCNLKYQHALNPTEEQNCLIGLAKTNEKKKRRKEGRETAVVVGTWWLHPAPCAWEVRGG